MKPRRIILAVLIIFLAFIIISMATAPTNLTSNLTFSLPEFIDLNQTLDPSIVDKYAVAIDGNLVFSNSQTTQPTASTAKMILALMVMEKRPFSPGETGPTIEITQEFYNLYTWYVANGGSYTPVAVGEQISEYDALASALLPSSNNMADTLAIWAFGDLNNYREYASQRLADWGLTQTTLGNDASGFSETTTSSAGDLAIIGQKIIENPVLAEIVSLKSKEIPVAGLIENTNQLLDSHNIIGIKTGFIGDPSGYCLVTAYKLNNHIITVAVLNAPTRASSFSISETIVETLQNNLKETTIAEAGTDIGLYESWWTGKVPIKLETDAVVLGWNQAEQEINLNMNGSSGVLTVQIEGQSYEYSVSAGDIALSPSLWQRFLHAIFLL